MTSSQASRARALDLWVSLLSAEQRDQFETKGHVHVSSGSGREYIIVTDQWRYHEFNVMEATTVKGMAYQGTWLLPSYCTYVQGAPPPDSWIVQWYASRLDLWSEWYRPTVGAHPFTGRQLSFRSGNRVSMNGPDHWLYQCHVLPICEACHFREPSH